MPTAQEVGEHERGTPSLGGVGGLPERFLNF